MRVRMLTTVAGPSRVLEVGEEYDLDPKEARDLCARPEDMPRAEPVATSPSGRKLSRDRGVEER